MVKELNETGDLLDETKKFAKEQLNEADKAYTAAGNSLTEVEKLKIPVVDVEEVIMHLVFIATDKLVTVILLLSFPFKNCLQKHVLTSLQF